MKKTGLIVLLVVLFGILPMKRTDSWQQYQRAGDPRSSGLEV